MHNDWLARLYCPNCKGELKTTSGSVSCQGCRAQYPVLAGVLVLVPDVGAYLVEHVKGISRYVDDSEIPKKHLAAFREARGELEDEHIEEDLEAERVTALYVMTHYLRAKDIATADPLLDGLIKDHWDNGPFARIKKLITQSKGKPSLVELGCGVGGLYAALRENLGSYLGLDSSFASIALARHLALGAPLKDGRQLVPDDLLAGAVSREVKIKPGAPSKNAEFVVCDLGDPPLKPGAWDMTAALNVIDMLPDPRLLPQLQYELLKPRGVAIQSCPYVWHPQVAAELRSSLPKKITDSAAAVEHLYKEAGFSIGASESHVPWLFFKHRRQLEIYSVHLFSATKSSRE